MRDKHPVILMIEDSEIDRELVRRQLGDAYRIEEATTIEEGFAAIDVQRPALILIDYHLPGVDSLELIEQFTNDNLPVIVLTGDNSPEVIVAAMLKGARNYLIKKQLHADTLAWAIKTALEDAALKNNYQEQKQQLMAQSEMLRDQNRRIRRLASALSLAEQRERKRIAKIVHDRVQQLLYGAQIRLHLIAEDLPEEALPQIRDNAIDAARFLEEAIDVARTLSAEISLPVERSEGVGAALQWLAAHFKHTYDLHVDLEIQSDYMLQQDELHILVIDLVRELLFNVVKHANVKEAEVKLYHEDGVQKICVADEGVGFEKGDVVQPEWKPEHGYGIYSVRERLGLFGGSLDIETHPNNGARIEITLPKD